MNMMRGFLGSYLLGLAPSRIPPCGLARSVDEALAEVAVTVLVITSVTYAVTVAILSVLRQKEALS